MILFVAQPAKCPPYQAWTKPGFFFVRTYIYVSKKFKNFPRTNTCGYLIAFIFFFADICNYLQTFAYPTVIMLMSISHSLNYLLFAYIFFLTYVSKHLQILVYQIYKHANIRSYLHLYVGCKLLPGFTYACSLPLGTQVFFSIGTF